ncbi:MAG: ketol-acid reductoisomerase [Nitrososphaerota archaeon]|jgi:ketol-acid reductoisomerase|nr:ketol-acid reductoisomerase [Nitrososphaerota archaeon]
MAKIDFGGVQEDVITRKEFTIAQAQQILKNEVIATIGYGIQGRSQALNMRDNGIKIIIGQRKDSKTYQKAIDDGWVPGENLFNLEEAAQRGTIKMILLTDAAQKEEWPNIKRGLKKGDALYFSHGFSIVFKEQTGVIPPDDVDVILVAPKGSGTSVRRNFVDGSGINSSFAIFQDATGKATERTKALGIAIGSGYLFPTTFEKETYSDLTGERGTLMGAIAGIIEAQYSTLREHGHSPSEAFNETVEELTQSLIRLVDENGMDWMYNNCSETARIGALRWKERFRSATKPVFDSLYELTAAGEESRIVLERSKESNYKQRLADELQAMGCSELWRTGATVRSLRPNKQKEQKQ